MGLEIKTNRHKTPRTLLDLGCGVGEDLVTFANLGLRVSGVDGSKVAIVHAKRNLKTLKIRPTTLTVKDLSSFIPEQYDIYFSKLTFAFIKNKTNFLKNLRKSMPNTSSFILITPVKHKGIRYHTGDKPMIAVNFHDVLKSLTKNFGTVVPFHHNYIGKRMDVVTFLCFK
jgi:cyclopropane fatty-acyl-phospholipid synthase-like methyltransferase